MKAKLIAAGVLLAAGVALGFWCAWKLHPGSSPVSGEYQTTLSPAVVLPAVAQSQPSKLYEHTQMTKALIGDATSTTDGPITAKHDEAQHVWTFSDKHMTFSFKDETGAGTYKLSNTYAGRIVIEQGKGLRIKDVKPELWEVINDKPTRQLPVEAWDIDIVRPTGESAIALEQNIGAGASIGGWRDAVPCLTYSFLRVGRLRLPSFLADTGGRVGAGVQARIWKPFHAGAFACWDLTEQYKRTLRMTGTINF